MPTNQHSSEAAPQTKALETTSTHDESGARTDSQTVADAEFKEDGDAAERLSRKYRKSTYELVLFWAVVVGITGGILLTASLGILVQQDLLQSVIWFVPLMILAAPIIYGRVRFALSSQIIARFLVSLLVMVIMIVVMFITILSGYPDEVWAQVAGNETLGSLGLVGTLSVLGLLIVLGLTLVLPLIFFAWLMYSLVQEDLHLVKVIVLAFITPVSFFFSIGLSIIVNSGW